MLLPGSVENPSQRSGKGVSGPCVFMADNTEFTGNTWHGDINVLYVDADGTSVPCCYHPRAGVFGNLLEQKYSEVMAGRKRAEFKLRMETDRKGMSVCGQCDMGPVGDDGPSFSAAFAL